MNVIRLYVRLLLMFAVVGLAILLLLVIRPLRKPGWSGSIIQACYKSLAAIIGLRIEVRGTMDTHRPLLLIGNHVSYIDIIVYGSLAPIVFMPKSEIADWPLIGTCCRLSDCVFIDRRVSKTAENLGAIHTALQHDKPLLLFAEGTTSDGKRLLPMRSSYFKILEGETGVKLQPVLVMYTRINNLPVDSCDRPKIAWYGNMELWPHAKKLLSLHTITAVVEFLPAVDTSQFASRKEIAAHSAEVLQAAYLRRTRSDV